MNIRIHLTCLLLVLGASAAPAQIVFQDLTFANALTLAHQEGKMLFLDAVTATCAPCKRMVRETFTDPEVATLFNAQFVNLRMDLNLGEGPDVQTRYNITDFPTLLFMDGNGELVEVHVGFLNAQRFLAFGQSVLAPDFVTLSALQKQFEAHPEDRKIASAYILRQKAAGFDVEAAWQTFRLGMQGAALLYPENWATFQALIMNLDAPEATYFTQHLQEFAKKYNPEVVHQKFIALHHTAILQAMRQEDWSQFDLLRAQLVATKWPKATEEALYLDLQRHLNTADWDAFFATALALDKRSALTTDMLDWIASNLAMGATNPDHLVQALAWSERAVAQEASYAHLDTKFNLLIRLNRSEEAIVVGKAAIEAAKTAKEPYGSTEEALLKLSQSK